MRHELLRAAQFAWKKELFNILYGTMPMWQHG